jgi:hypothetical protein
MNTQHRSINNIHIYNLTYKISLSFYIKIFINFYHHFTMPINYIQNDLIYQIIPYYHVINNCILKYHISSNIILFISYLSIIYIRYYAK